MDEEQMLERIRSKYQRERDARLSLAAQHSDALKRNVSLLKEATAHLCGFPINVHGIFGAATFYCKTYNDDPTLAHCGLTVLGSNRVATPTRITPQGYFDNYENHLTLEQVVKWWENAVFDSIQDLPDA